MHLAVGDSVEIVCDALPGQALSGVVTAIRPVGEQKRGEVTYTVTVQVDGDTPASLYWGMTAVVRKVR